MAYTDVDAVKEYRGLESTDEDGLIASAHFTRPGAHRDVLPYEVRGGRRYDA